MNMQNVMNEPYLCIIYKPDFWFKSELLFMNIHIMMSQSPINWLFIQLNDQISNKENIKGQPFVMSIYQ